MQLHYLILVSQGIGLPSADNCLRNNEYPENRYVEKSSMSRESHLPYVKVHRSLYRMAFIRRVQQTKSLSRIVSLYLALWGGLVTNNVFYNTLELLWERSSHLLGIQYGISFGSNGRQLERIVKFHNRQSSKAPQRYVNPSSALEPSSLQAIDCANSMIMAAGNDLLDKNFCVDKQE